MNLIYAKKFRFPDNSANMIQGVNLVAAFSHHNINTNAFFSFNDTINDRNSFLKDCYGINFSRQSNQIHFTSQKLRGLNYNLWLIKNIINKKNVVLYTREGTEASRSIFLKHLKVPAVPLFHEVHKFDFNITGNSNIENKLRKKISKLFSQITGLIFIDELLAKQTKDVLNIQTPIYIAPSGVNLTTFSCCNYSIPTSKIILGYFGQLIPEKGLLLLLQAFGKLPEHYHLRLIGQCNEQMRNNFSEIARTAASRIQFMGYVDHASLPHAMQGVHISVIPSIMKNQFLSPLKLAESLAMGMPIVCTPMPHLQHILTSEKNAVFAHEATPEGLAAAIRRLGDFPQRLIAMQQENRNYAEKFSWESRAQGIIHFMQEVKS